MKITPLAAVVDYLADGSTVECVEGTLTKLYGQKSGTLQNGKPWSLQNGELFDGQTTIPVLFKDREEVPQSYKGRRVRIEAKQGDRITGLYAFDDEYQGTKTRKIKATSTASIYLIEGGAPAQQAQQRPATPQGAGDTAKALDQTKQVLGRLTTAWLLSYDAAVHLAHTLLERHGYAITPQAIGIMADKFFAELCRGNKSDVIALPFAPPSLRIKPLAEHVMALDQQIATRRPIPTVPSHDDGWAHTPETEGDIPF